jgi:hypothetical protein
MMMFVSVSSEAPTALENKRGGGLNLLILPHFLEDEVVFD